MTVRAAPTDGAAVAYHEPPMSDLVPLYPHPEGRRPWPTEAWAEEGFAPGVDRARLEKALDSVFVQPWPESDCSSSTQLFIDP